MIQLCHLYHVFFGGAMFQLLGIFCLGQTLNTQPFQWMPTEMLEAAEQRGELRRKLSEAEVARD